MNDENDRSFADSFAFPKEQIFNGGQLGLANSQAESKEMKPTKKLKTEGFEDDSMFVDSFKAPIRMMDPIIREIDSNSANVMRKKPIGEQILNSL